MRIDQRTQLNYFDIAKLLDTGLAVDVGNVVVFNKQHWLFYSEKDDCCFVAIQDSVTGTIITVLPIDYHEVLAWKIKEELFEQAVKKVKEYNPTIVKMPATVIRIKVRYICDRGYAKIANVTKRKASDYNSDISRVLNDESLDSEIKYQCELKGINVSDVIEISISLGDQQITVNWE